MNRLYYGDNLDHVSTRAVGVLYCWRTAILVIAVAGSCPGCFAMDEYEETVRSARTAIPIAVEMEKLFPETDHFITHYRFDDPGPWNSVSYFGGRYQIEMQVKVDIDYSARRVKQIGQPTFLLFEIEKIEGADEGAIQAHIGRNFRFGIKEWKKLVEARGDVSAIGFKAKKGPIPHHVEYVAAERDPRIRISLLNKKSKPRTETSQTFKKAVPYKPKDDKAP